VWPEQTRATTALAQSVYDALDFTDSREFELLAQKACAANALIEENATGEMDSTAAILNLAGTSNTDGSAATLTSQKLEGGLYRYFRANSGQGLKAFHYDRPGSNVMAYQDAIIRDAFVGLEWNYLFTVDPAKIGGASMRVVVEQINRTVKNLRAMLAKSARRADRFAVACAIDNGELAFDREWFRWDYMPARMVTADAKYDSDVAVQEINSRLSTHEAESGKRGRYWQDDIDQWCKERKYLFDLADKIGLDLSRTVSEETAESFSAACATSAMRATTASEADLCACRPNQASASNPTRLNSVPNSDTAGTSGRSGRRSRDVTASATTLPFWICGRAVGRLSIRLSTSPPITAVMAGPAPR
jgi:hypothetical protein